MSDSSKRTSKEKITELKRELDRLSRDYENALNEKDELEERVESLKAEISKAREAFRRLEKDASDQKAVLEKRISRLVTHLKEIEDALRRKEEESVNLRAIVEEMKKMMEKLQQKILELSSPPHNYCTFVRVNEDKTVDVRFDGRRLAVHHDPDLDVSGLKEGQILRLGPTMAVLKTDNFDPEGDAATIREFLDEKRVIVSHRFEEEKIVHLMDNLIGKVKVGDRVLLDSKAVMALEKLPKLEVREFEIEEVPNVTFEDIGGLDEQIQTIKENIVWPFLHQEIFRQHLLRPIKGALFFGPPGNGKTMLGKALANHIAKEVQRIKGLAKPMGYFMYIPGPAFLRGIVGQTEGLMRDVFNTARAKAKEGDIPVIIFIDEMEAIASVRGSGISSDVDKTNVPQLTSLIDGLEELNNVIIVGASNRQDLIDSAILREGRLDLKIRIDRPNEKAARQIFSKHLISQVPIHPKYLEKDEYIPLDREGNPRRDAAGNAVVFKFNKDPQKVVDYFIERAVARIFNLNLRVTYKSRSEEQLNLKNYISGAMIKNIVDRTKRLSIKNHVLKQETVGIQTSYIYQAIEDASRENEELVRYGGEITSVRSSVAGGDKKDVEDLEKDTIL